MRNGNNQWKSEIKYVIIIERKPDNHRSWHSKSEKNKTENCTGVIAKKYWILEERSSFSH